MKQYGFKRLRLPQNIRFCGIQVVMIFPKYLIQKLHYAILYVCLLLSCNFVLQAQTQNIFIEATVLDKDTKAPLPFTNVIIDSTSIGTITNEDGKFELTFNQKHKNKDVIFSFIGYKNTRIPVSRFKKANKKVFLSADATPLSTIVVKTTNKYKELVNNAIEKVSENYEQKPVLLYAYYRELTQVDDQYIKFSDAATQIYYSPYDQNFDPHISRNDYMKFQRVDFDIKKVPFPEPKEFIADHRDQVKILALRKSDNLRDYKILKQSKKLQSIDPNYLKWIENNEIGGGVLRLTGADKIKRKADFLNPKAMNQYKFRKVRKSTYNNLPVQIISFFPKDSTSKKAIYKGEIVIDEQSGSIVNYQFGPTKFAKKMLNQRFSTQLKTPPDIEKKNQLKFITRTIELIDYNIYVTYAKSLGKWHLKRIKCINEYKNSGDLFDNFAVTTTSEMIINSLENQEGIQKIAKPDVFESVFFNALFDYKMPYNQTFWKGYSTLVPTGVVGKALEDLETKSSLQTQFEDHK